MEQSMCAGTFHRISDSEKSACVTLNENMFDTGQGQVGYVRNNPALAGLKKGDLFSCPAGWSVEERTDEKGDVMRTKPTEEHPEGEPLSFFVWGKNAVSPVSEE